MIALISSTLYPSASHSYDGARSRFSNLERLEHTKGTVASLVALGFKRIVIADNSLDWHPATEASLAPAEVWRIPTPEFRNRGLSELFLLRAAAARLPANEPVIKVSGRYLLSRNPLTYIGDADVAVKGDSFTKRNGAMSTRAYGCRDVATFQRLLTFSITEIFAYPARIVGPGSLLRIIRASLWPAKDTFSYDDPPHSIELVMARSIKLMKLKVHFLSPLGVRGILAGSGETIDE
ncbi:hypothetical protein [Rariglobus hedericola]|uniref:Uncharacterized protein n=1 Tax=Rariglobus hedericola TaxID=2597822 RepID=A0A556QL97_9BACT|nr:hypothetical protein [Rariglobus hedericola]TSJ77372.1 hypothetical protein FPL22_14870 [Rariglobus hedericola]